MGNELAPHILTQPSGNHIVHLYLQLLIFALSCTVLISAATLFFRYRVNRQNVRFEERKKAFNSEPEPVKADPLLIDTSLASIGFAEDDALFSPNEIATVVQKSREHNHTLFLPNELTVLHVLPEHEQTFVGYELLQSLLTAGLRFGAMNIFHCYGDLNDDQSILFSVAQATEPGIFDINRIGACECHGLTLFMNKTDQQNSNEIYDVMLNTAELLADELGGKVFTDLPNTGV